MDELQRLIARLAAANKNWAAAKEMSMMADRVADEAENSRMEAWVRLRQHIDLLTVAATTGSSAENPNKEATS